ncbi:MAG: general secretion pathway protein C [Candidatus Endobugula sp.]|jgi:general secretion pathway protein C
MMLSHHSKGLKWQLGNTSLLLLIKIMIAVLLVAWLANSMLQLVQMSSPATEVVLAEEAQVNNSDDVPPRPPVDMAVLKAIPLFGELVVNQAPLEVEPEQQEEDIVETTLNVVLKGLFTSTNSELGQAIISKGNKDQLYQVGESIEGLSKVKLLEVFADRVKLDNRGTAEVLYLYAEGERLVSSNGGGDLANQNSSFVENEINQAKGTEWNYSLPAKKTKKLNEIMRVVRERDKATGEMLGFRVLPGRDRESFERSGLQINDVITSIDGDKLTDLRSAMSIYRNKREATQVSLLISRDGSVISLDINLNELSLR